MGYDSGFISGVNDPDTHYSCRIREEAEQERAEAAERKLARVVELLKAARCPNCDGSGAYMVSGGPEQCQWCDERATATGEGK